MRLKKFLKMRVSAVDDPNDSDRFHYEVSRELEMVGEEDPEFISWMEEREKDDRAYLIEGED